MSYLCVMKIDLSTLTINELMEVREQVNNLIADYDDGFFYICQIRSYGRNWTRKYRSSQHVQDLCDEYNGEDGIVDVYSNNPDLDLSNYGEVKFVPTEEDFQSWKDYNSLVSLIKDLEPRLKAWDERDSVPYHSRPTFSPTFTWEELDGLKKELSEFDMNFVTPVNYKK